MMSGDDYGQAFHDGETTGAAEEIRRIITWLRGIPEEWIQDWGLNATAEIADMLESGRWRVVTDLPGGEEEKGR